MIIGIQDVYYNITDREHAIRFYTEALGMKCMMNEEYWNIDMKITINESPFPRSRVTRSTLKVEGWLCHCCDANSAPSSHCSKRKTRSVSTAG